MPSAPACLALVGAFVLRVAAQSAVASNTTTVTNPNLGGVLVMSPAQDPIPSETMRSYYLLPLTDQAFDILPHNPGTTAFTSTSVYLVTPNAPNAMTASSLPQSAVAVASCDAQDYSGNISMTDVIGGAIAANVTSIVLYSITSFFCNLENATDYAPYTRVYSLNNTMQDIQTSNYSQAAPDIVSSLAGTYAINVARIYSGVGYGNFYHQLMNSTFGGAGTTAIAMIILYSITGLITALFLIIIVTGAIRAHRHPERYGPRNIMGRPRQSRAKGIARAMLDTIPIVKFGEKRDDKDPEQQAQPVELANRDADASAADPQPAPASGAVGTAANLPPLEITTTNHIADASSPAHVEDEDAQGCSICTDDFERGQDIRVLPCGHQFHPACVDPWLLDVSGTCPLCRVHLNPNSSSNTPTNELPPPLDPASAEADSSGNNASGRGRRDTIRHFFARSRDGQNLSTANREERIDTLRRWRLANRERSQAAAAPGASGGAAGEAGPSGADASGAGAQEGEAETEEGRSRLKRLSGFMQRRR